MAQTIQRKCALIPRRKGLAAHSALSMVKKAAAGIQETSTPYQKMLYMEKNLVQALDKYILAKVEDADAWTSLMEYETNPAIRGMYLCLSEIDRIWVILQQRYRLELPEQRRLFKQLLKGEQELAKLRKQAACTATKVAKLRKQIDEVVAKIRSNKGDPKRLETLKKELAMALSENRMAQKQHGMALENHRKYKHNEVRKLTKNLSEVELQLHKDCRKVSEVKAQICEMYMKETLNKQDEANIHRVSDACRDLLRSLCGELGIATENHRKLDRSLTPPTSQPPSAPANQGSARPPAPPPRYDQLEKTSTHSDRNEFYLDVSYTPIPEKDSDDDECEADYIYWHEGKSFRSASDAAAAVDDVDDDDDDDDCYEYVPPDLGEATSGELPEYLDILDNNTEDPKPRAVHRNSQASQSSVEGEEEIFGSISSLKIKPRCSGIRPRSTETAPEGYDCLWQSQTAGGDAGSTSDMASAPSRRSWASTGSAWSSVSGSSVSSSDSDQRPLVPGRGKINKPST